ncbi:MAG: hypothetical protein IMW98_02000 [Firmicutes bacterium]|nr:hypothetical protein [Bacillota bacterium]
MNEERRLVLKMLEEGKINADQAAALLRALAEGETAGGAGAGDAGGEPAGGAAWSGGGSHAGGAAWAAGAARGPRMREPRETREPHAPRDREEDALDLEEAISRAAERIAEHGERIGEWGERLAQHSERWAERLAERIEKQVGRGARGFVLLDHLGFGFLGPEAEETEERVLPLPAGGTLELDVETANGRVEIAAAERADVRVQLVKRARAADAERAAERARAIGRVEMEGARLRVHPGPVTTAGGWTMHVRIEVPRGAWLSGRVRTHNGRIALHGLSAEGAAFAAESSNGHIEAEDLAGGRWTVLTHNGHLAFRDVDASLSARTHNGRVDWRAARVTADREVQLGTHNGSMRVELPNCGYEVEGETYSGHVEVTAPGLEAVREGGRRRVRGRREGQPHLRLQAVTHNGSLSVRAAGAEEDAHESAR